jgi:hypothetical protein
VKGERVSPPKNSAFAIKALTANFGASQVKSKEKEIKWLKPIKGKLKLNTDASYYTDGSGAAGGVLRNEKGEVMAGYYCILENMLSPATAEATAILRGFELLEKLGCTSCQIETDCLDIIKECNGDLEINSPYAAILAECFQIPEG